MSIEGTIFGKALDYVVGGVAFFAAYLWKRSDSHNKRLSEHDEKLGVMKERLDNLPTTLDIDEAKSEIMQKMADSDIRSQGYRDGSQAIMSDVRVDIAAIKATLASDTKLADAIARAIASRPERKAKSQ